MLHRIPGLIKKLGTAAQWNVGTAKFNVVQLDTNAKLPAVDGSLLTNLPSGVLQGYISGLTLSNDGVSPNTVLDIATGACTSDDATVLISFASAFTKNCNAAWAAGTGNGALDVGTTLAAATWYHVYAIKNTTSGVSDYLVSTSASSPTMPSGYTKKRRIGSFKTDATSHIIAFLQRDDMFLWYNPLMDVNVTNPGTVAVLAAINVPSGVRVKACVVAFVLNGTPVGGEAYISCPDTIDFPLNESTSAFMQAGTDPVTSVRSGAQIEVWTNTSSQVRYKFFGSDTNLSFHLGTLGWTDRRGKN